MEWLITANLVATRLSGLVMMMPAFSSIQKKTRLAIALSLTLIITPLVPSAGPVFNFYQLLLGMAGEFIIGVVMGGVVFILFSSFLMAAEAVGMQIGLRIASVFDPVSKNQTGLIGSFVNLMGLTIFLGTNLHLKLISTVANTFYVVGPGAASDPIMASKVWAPALSVAMSAGASLAGPVIVLILLIQTMLGVMVRLAPSMNVFFAVGLTVTIYAGLSLFNDSLPILFNEHFRIMSESLNLIPAIADMVK